MKMLGLAYNQGGIINFLGKQPEVTAPVRAQSHVDSPPTQLAYITDAEKDLLVKANIHGSMDGQPNQGPAGLESLDDWYNTPGGGVSGGSGENVHSSGVDTSGYTGSGSQSGNQGNQGSGGYESSEAYGINPGMAVGGSDGTVFVSPLSAGPGKDQENAYVPVLPDKQKELEALAEAKAAEAKVREENKKRGIISEYLHGTVLDDYVGDKNWVTPPGQHKLRSQLDRLTAKYGKDFLDTEQAKVLMNYLSGVAVERGGGLGARDKTYGGNKFATETGEADPELEKQRQALLAQISGMGTPFGGQDISTILAGVTRDGIGADMTPEQYFNFRQQLMSADPTPGNQLYKDAFPWSSGSGVKSLTRFLPGMGAAQTFLGGMLPEQSEWADWAMNERPFYDTSTPDTGNMGEFMRREPSWWNTGGESQPVEDEDEDEDEDENDAVDLTPTPTPFPTYGTGIAGLDWASLAPQFGPQYPGHYSNQGIQPNFANWYNNLNKYYG